MTVLSVKPFELSEYNVGTFIIKNPRNSRYGVISEYQTELLHRIEDGEPVAQLLFPQAGVATSKHFEQCVGLFSSLRELRLLVQNQEWNVLIIPMILLQHQSKDH